MHNLAFRSAKQLASLIRRKKVGCLELLNHYLKRIDRHNPRINAVIFTDIRRPGKGRKRRTGPLPKARYGAPCTVSR